MKGKIIGIGIVIAIIVSVIVLTTLQQEHSPSVIVGKNLTPLPEGKHLQLSLNESVGIKSVS